MILGEQNLEEYFKNPGLSVRMFKKIFQNHPPLEKYFCKIITFFPLNPRLKKSRIFPE